MILGSSVVTGAETTARSKVYVVQRKVCLMSKTTLIGLGCLPKEFPEIGRFLQQEECQAVGMVRSDAPARGGTS